VREAELLLWRSAVAARCTYALRATSQVAVLAVALLSVLALAASVHASGMRRVDIDTTLASIDACQRHQC